MLNSDRWPRCTSGARETEEHGRFGQVDSWQGLAVLDVGGSWIALGVRNAVDLPDQIGNRPCGTCRLPGWPWATDTMRCNAGWKRQRWIGACISNDGIVSSLRRASGSFEGSRRESHFFSRFEERIAVKSDDSLLRRTDRSRGRVGRARPEGLCVKHEVRRDQRDLSALVRTLRLCVADR